MNDIIRLLPDSVANQIAAGEVIQRPASVIKELVENAVDAGATNIEVIIKDAGRTLIQVVDNGSGMTDTDARMAFERHATSKISAAADLYTLHTMGFRGEALASIAAVAQIELRTMPQGATVGTRLEINGSKVEVQEPCACAPGTNMQVKNLFYTLPARRKFLKKDSVEFAAILREFERLALVNPSVDFTLYHNDVIVHKLTHAPMKRRICDLFGKNLDKQLLPVATDTSMVRINGFIGLPANARKRNPLQYLLINGRNMRHPVFHKAILECYEQLIPQDEQPNYFIEFAVSPDTIDVNIHPTKNEIKFENEFGIRQILMAAVKESLGRYNAMPAIDFDTDNAPDIPAFNPDANADHGVKLDTSYNPFATSAPAFPEAESVTMPSRGFSGTGSAPRAASSSKQPDWEKLYEEFARARSAELEPATIPSALNSLPTEATTPEEETADARPADLSTMASPLSTPDSFKAVQLLQRYIATPCQAGLMLIDQHRAHERVLYDRFIDLARLSAIATQSVLFPEMLQLSAAQSALLEEILPQVTNLGFDLSPLGDGAWNVCGVPAVIDNANPNEILMGMIEMAELGGTPTAEELHSRLALSMARSVAIRSGVTLGDAEIQHLLSDLFKLPAPNYTPDGLPVISVMDARELAARFARQ